MRRFIRASAVMVPLLHFSGFLLLASRHVLWGAIPLISALILLRAFPYYLTDDSFCQRPDDDADRGWLWVRRTTWYAIIVWGLSQPEIEAFRKRAMDDGGLWDWKLLAPVAVLTFCSIVWGLRRAAAVSDRAIYSYFA
jgi:hypothetical protein